MFHQATIHVVSNHP